MRVLTAKSSVFFLSYKNWGSRKFGLFWTPHFKRKVGSQSFLMLFYLLGQKKSHFVTLVKRQEKKWWCSSLHQRQMDLLNRDFLSGKESSRGKKFTCWGKRNIDSLLVCSFAVHLRVLCSLGHLAHVSSQMLLASTGNFSSYPFFVYGIILAPITESWYCVGTLLECSLSWRQQIGHCQLGDALGRKEGVDQRRTHLPVKTHV